MDCDFDFKVTIEIVIQSAVSSSDWKLNDISSSNFSPACIELSLEDCERNAAVIFSGTIRNLLQSEKQNKQISAYVEIKRILKGYEVIEGFTGKYWLIDNIRYVEVHGLHDPSICDSSAKLYDTRIFFVNQVGTELHLNSSLIRITVGSLERIEAAIRTLSLCGLSGNLQLTCLCHNISCDNVSSPVCASDGQTYENECLMNVESCKVQRIITKLFSGNCSKDYNPCEGLGCSVYSVCLYNQSEASCVCPQICEPDFQPVCGNDSKTYVNQCELEKNSCTTGQLITVNYHGPCHPPTCNQSECSHGAQCVLIDGHPVCVCPSCPPDEFSPVCGSNGFSYSSECNLTSENCERKQNIYTLYNGSCKAIGPCTGGCEFYAGCQLDDRGNEHCICSEFCVEVDNKVCGSDGVTYGNECKLRVASCITKKPINVTGKGHCDICTNVTCRHGSRCENGECVCQQQCSESKDLVCANDGNTYINECMMQLVGCQQAVDLKVLHPGDCEELSGSGELIGTDLCNETTCRYGGICVFNSNGLMECKCNFTCPVVRSTVCGSDGMLYSSECHLLESSCKMQKLITVQSIDNCEQMFEEMCEGALPLVDPSTGEEYNCSLDWEICPSGSYCHFTTTDAKCCEADRPISNCDDTTYGCCEDNVTASAGPNNTGCPDTRPISNCDDTTYGCCDDNVTASAGPNNTGCPEVCQCFEVGSLDVTCEPNSGQCTCKPGVLGPRCDRCAFGYWGLTANANGYGGCIPCSCDRHGSLREDCDQRTGGCICHPGISGHKCSLCSNGQFLDLSECVENVSAINGTEEDNFTIHPTLYEILDFVTLETTTDYATEVTTDPSSSVTEITEEFISVDDNSRTSLPPLPIATSTIIPVQTTKPIEFNVFKSPSFMFNSFIQLRHFERASSIKYSVELTFVPRSDYGIIFYTGQSGSLSGDFFSIALKNKIVEFRFNLGSGMAVIRSNALVQMRQWNRVFAQMISTHGILKLNDHEEVNKTSQGNYSILDLGRNAIFLGLPPVEKHIILKHVGLEIGFAGCVGLLEVSDSANSSIYYNLTYPGSPDIEKADLNGEPCPGFVPGIESPCLSNPCSAGRICQSSETNEFTCICPDGWEGENCEKVAWNNSLFFNGSNFHGYDNAITERHLLQLSNYYEITFRTTEDCGVLLLQHKNFTMDSDYLTIVINDEKVEASFNLGNKNPEQQFVIKSAKSVSDNQWHTVRFTRTKAKAQISVDDEIPSTAVSDSGGDWLDTNGILWLGGVGCFHNLPKLYACKFVGCISDVKIDSKRLNLVRDIKDGGRPMNCK